MGKRRKREAAALADELHRRDQARGDFLAAVAHDLRTPLACMVGFGATLAERWPDLTDDERTRFLQRIVANGEELDRRIANFLEYSRLEYRDIDLQCRPCDLAAAVAAAVERTRFVLERHLVVVSVPDNTAVANDCALTRVIENLLGNAAKYSPPGSAVRVTAERTDDGVIVSIEDDGPGVAPEDAERIFDRFYRAKTSGRGPSGAGIGLAGVRQLVELMGGQVWVETPPDGGSRFRFSLRSPDQARVRRPASVLSLHSAW